MKFIESLDLAAHPWLVTGLSAVICLVITLIVQRILYYGSKRLFSSHAVLIRLIERSHAPATMVLPLLALEVVWQQALDGLYGIETVRQVNSLLLIFGLTWMALRYTSSIGDAVVMLNPSSGNDNLRARRIQTQSQVLTRCLAFIVILVGAAAALMLFPGVRKIGASLLASAGVAGLAIGLAAKSVLGNLLAGLQIAMTQPIRIDDVLIVQGEWGRVEEITATYVVINIWDERRLVVPLTWFIENPFQNWTRSSANIMGSVFWSVDFRMPIEPLRLEVERLCRADANWDGRFYNLQVTDTTEKTMQLRALMTSSDSSKCFDMRCRVREGLIDYMQREYVEFLPRERVAVDSASIDKPA